MHPWVAELTAPVGGMEEGRQEEQQHEERRIAEYMEEGTTIDSVPLRVVECCDEAGDAFLVHPTMYHAPQRLTTARRCLASCGVLTFSLAAAQRDSMRSRLQHDMGPLEIVFENGS